MSHVDAFVLHGAYIMSRQFHSSVSELLGHDGYDPQRVRHRKRSALTRRSYLRLFSTYHWRSRLRFGDRWRCSALCQTIQGSLYKDFGSKDQSVRRLLSRSSVVLRCEGEIERYPEKYG